MILAFLQGDSGTAAVPGWQDRSDYYYFHSQNVPITEPYNTCTETNTCFNIYSLGPESMMVQLSILPQPSGKCLTKQMALPGFFTWVGGWRFAQPEFLIQYVCPSTSTLKHHTESGEQFMGEWRKREAAAMVCLIWFGLVFKETRELKD